MKIEHAVSFLWNFSWLSSNPFFMDYFPIEKNDTSLNKNDLPPKNHSKNGLSFYLRRNLSGYWKGLS